MLVLKRQVGEVVTIGDNIVVRVVAVRGSRVELGFETPRDVAIERPDRHDKKEDPAHAHG